jgi:hypothetical protein
VIAAGVAIFLIAGLTQATGSASRPRPRRRSAEPGRLATAAGMWLVPTAGAPPTIAAENRNAGTRAWRLRGPADDVGGMAYGSIAGYVSSQSVSPGQTVRIYANAPGAHAVRIRIFRIGWYGGAGGREVFVSRRLPVGRQPPCAHVQATGLTECHWHPTLSLRIPRALSTGVYIAKISTGTGADDCLFVVQSLRPQPLLVQLPTPTYEAYNAWGGDSVYPGGSDQVGVTGTTQGVAVSYDRPYDSVTGAGQFFSRDVAMVWFLERYGYPVSYTTGEAVANRPQQLTGHRALIDFGHSEYWSGPEEGAWSGALRRGTSLLFFGSDTLAWRVRFERATAASSQAGSPGHVMVAYKEHAAEDPKTADPTGIFTDRGARLAGSAYLGCITPRLAQAGPPVYRYYSWSPSPTLTPAWLFARTGITAATRISGIVGYELDQRTADTPPGTLLVGEGTAPCMGQAPDEPGEPVPHAGDDLAETTLSTGPGGAIVFDTGTLGWELGLEPVPNASPDAPRAPDPRVVAMTRNLLAHVLGRG